MSDPSPTYVADAAVNDPLPDRPDDFAGPPITAAEAALLEKLAKVCGELAFEAAERVQAASQAVRAAWASGASAKAASKALDEATRRFELFSRAVRLTIALKAKRVMELQAWRKRRAAAASAGGEQRAPARPEQATAIAQESFARSGDPTAATQARQPGTSSFPEREYERGLPDLPVGEVVAGLCRDLGQVVIPQDWHGRPWAEDAEALFGCKAAAPEAAAADPAPSDDSACPAEAAMPQPQAEPPAPPAEAAPPTAEPDPPRPQAPPEILRSDFAELRKYRERRRRGWTQGQNPAQFGTL
jgi:hypothetical protein